MSETTEGLDLEALKGRVQHGVVAWRRDIAATDLESLFSEIERLKSLLADCGGVNCMGHAIEKHVRWVCEDRLIEAKAEIERLKRELETERALALTPDERSEGWKGIAEQFRASRDEEAQDAEEMGRENERLRAEVGRLEARLQAEADVAARRHAEVTEERDRNAQRRMTRAKQVHEEIERLRAENAALVEDKARLDDCQSIIAAKWATYYGTDRHYRGWGATFGESAYLMIWPISADMVTEAQPSVREAIDAARRGTP